MNTFERVGAAIDPAARDRLPMEVIMLTDATELSGKVVNGIVLLDQPGNLEEGTEVRVRPVLRGSHGEGDKSSLSEMLLSFAGTVELSSSK